MPVRVKPVHDLGPCSLDLESIQSMCTLMDSESPYTSYSASDGVWEIYNEGSATFLAAIADREKLDSFYAELLSTELLARIEKKTAQDFLIRHDARKVKLFFDRDQARVTFELAPTDLPWVDHFMLDLKKHIRRPLRGQRRSLMLRLLFIVAGVTTAGLSTPAFAALPIGEQTKIIVKKQEPNPTMRSIRDNLAASIIYDLFKYIIVFALGALAVWLYNRHGFNLGEWLPGIAGPSPSP